MISAEQAGALTTEQELRYAKQCLALLRAFAKVGIVALVDEATGFQDERAKDYLAQIFQAFIVKELRPWMHTFPEDFYKELFRLRELDYPNGAFRPQYFGKLTNDIVYKRLAPGVLEELKRVTPRSNGGGHKNKLFQRLTANVGYPNSESSWFSRDHHETESRVGRLQRNSRPDASALWWAGETAARIRC